MFSLKSKKSFLKAVLFKNTPIYAQFYVSSKCNLRCKQCNIINSNKDIPECNFDDIKRIADNFAKIGVAIVVLSGGEPFLRKDLPEIIREFESRGIHVRMQTNGIATEEQIAKAVEFGGRDVSVSLDSLYPELQSEINGGLKDSWERKIRTISLFTKYLPKKGSFASLGCVMQRQNLFEIENIIKFATEISYHTSIVPVHISEGSNPLAFRTPNEEIGFKKDLYEYIDSLIERVRLMRKEGYLIYDNDEFLDDVKRFVRDEPIRWRRKRKGICDSPNLYFTILPNGDFAPCIDYYFTRSVKAYDPDFPKVFYSNGFREEVTDITKACKGCMYGCFPEMTLSMRYPKVTMDRIRTFITSPHEKNWPLHFEEIRSKAERIRTEGGPSEKVRQRYRFLFSEEAFHDKWVSNEDINRIDVRKINEVCTAPEIRHIRKTMGDIRGKRILDAGCGLGEAAVYFAMEGAQVSCLDLSQGMLDAASTLARKNGVQVRTYKADLNDLELKDDPEFDIIYMGNVLHHANIDKVIGKIRRYLTPDGILVSWDPLAYNPIINIYRKIATEVRTKEEHPLKLKDIRLFKRYFKTVETKYYWFFTLFIFIIMASVQRRNPNKERFWKSVVEEGDRWAFIYRPLEFLDRAMLTVFPFLKPLCWNVVVTSKDMVVIDDRKKEESPIRSSASLQ